MLPQSSVIICVSCVNLLQAPIQDHHSHTHLSPTHSGTLWQKQSTWAIAEGNCMFPQPFPIHSTLEQLLRKISSLDPFQESCCLWKAFLLSFLRFPPCPWMLTSTSCQATAWVQPGELLQLTAWSEKAEGMSSISPFRW